MKKIIIIGLTFFCLAIILKAEEPDKIGSCTLYDLEGNEVRLSDFKGKPLILWFWTTWCPYCRKDIVRLNNIYPELKLSGIELLAINVDEPKGKIARFLKSHPVDFNIFQDRDGRCAFSHDIIAVPTYLLIDRKGKVEFRQNYFPKDTYKQLLLKQNCK